MSNVVDALTIARQKNSMKLMLKNIEGELEKISISPTDSAKDMLNYINVYLHRLSVLTAYYVYMFEVSQKQISSQEFDAIIYDVDKLIRIMLEKTPDTHFVVEVENIRKNFVYWEPLPTAILLKILKKIKYIILIMNDYLIIDTRLLSSFVSLLLKFTQLAINFVNVEAHNDPNSNQRKDYDMLVEIIMLNIKLQEFSFTKCMELLVTDESVGWGAKAIQILSNSKVLYTILNNNDKVKEIKDKIIAIHKRLNEDMKISKSSQKNESSMSLDTLLKIKE